MSSQVISDRGLNRALLARQLLLERSEAGVVDTVHSLVGMQGQAPLAPYVGLWSRLRGFDPAELSEALRERILVRATLLRGTVHLATAEDALTLRPLVEQAITRSFQAGFRKLLPAEHEADVLAVGRELLAARHMTRSELRSRFREQWPDRDADAMAYAVSYLIPVVQPTPRGVWGAPQGQPKLALLEEWIGRTVDSEPDVDGIVLRYLAAFGPASIADAQAWSGLTRLREVFDRLQRRLVAFASADGSPLFDLPGAPRPNEELPAAVRFLPEYDNVLFSHRDRRRIIDTNQRVPLPPGNGARAGTILIDGYLRGSWRVKDGILRVRPHRRLSDDDTAQIMAEAGPLARFLGATDVAIGEGAGKPN